MLAKITVLPLIALLVSVSQAADTSYAPGVVSRDRQHAVLRLSDLRSAYLQRAGVVRYDESNRTPAGLRQQLQRHFDVVLNLLRLDTPESIETALGRL
jgi:hypothetical protein